MLEQAILRMPRTVYSGVNALCHLKVILGKGMKKVAVFTDQGIIDAGLLKETIEYLEQAQMSYEILSDLMPEPTYLQAEAVVEAFKSTQADFIIAVGGGSVMDIAKLASILATDRYNVRDLLEDASIAQKFVETLMIPTTAGTGSEATPNSILAIPEKELKVGIVSETMIPDYVILDGNMIKNLPRHIAAATGIDALAHAIECFTSVKANAFSDIFALEALELIMNNIEEACHDSKAMEAKNAMLKAAFYAGVAITGSGTTAVHALSYPLGGKYHIPHGVANAMLLVPVMRFNAEVMTERFAKIYDRVVGDDTIQDAKTKTTWILNRMDEIVKRLEIPTDLKAYGIGQDDLDGLVTSAMEVKRLLDNNRKTMTPSDAKRIYQTLL
ncbi:MAG: alcohol dehydrogenase [Firmicutes bacterium HGW-Firmicutes-5]|nr:MAG: alcohol dehydrogenase [Firmicutes bacterium HGW-Firmicutes-5]